VLKWIFTAWLLVTASMARSDEPVRCSAQNSELATVPSIAAEPERYLGKCVALSGVMQRFFLFESVDGVYLQPREPLNPSSSGFRLGLDHISEVFSEEYRHVAITGRVQDCEAVRGAVDASVGPNEIVLISGYCHYYNGAYVWVDELEPRRGRPFDRRMGSYERKDYGDLEPAPQNWPHRATVEALAEQFLQALRTRDRERLAGLHFRDVGLEWEDDEEALLRFLLARDSPFADVRDGRAPPEQMILVERASLEPDADDDNYSAIVCFCREPSCAGRWPIASFDADNVRARPFVCTDVHPYIVYRRVDRVPHFTTQIGSGGLAEPRPRD
jgi:hypothetical protein